MVLLAAVVVAMMSQMGELRDESEALSLVTITIPIPIPIPIPMTPDPRFIDNPPQCLLYFDLVLVVV